MRQMISKTSNVFFLFIIISVLMFQTLYAQPPFEPSYGNIDFFKIAEKDYVDIYALNNLGQAVGSVVTFDDQYFTEDVIPFIWSDEGMTYLEIPEGKDFCFPFDINNKGQIVGRCDKNPLISPSGPEGSAILYTPEGELVDLGEIMGLRISWAKGINDKGQVVGCGEIDGMQRAFLWSEENGVTYIETLGGNWNIANDINDLGQIIGISETGSGELHGFLWKDGVIKDLGIFSGEKEMFELVKINNKGQILGFNANIDWQTGMPTDMSWFIIAENGIMVEIEKPEDKDFYHVYSFNNLGDFVGWYAEETEEGYLIPEAFFGTIDSGIVSLDEKIGLDAPHALAINDSRQIAGYFYYCDITWNPPPQPPSFDCAHYLYLWTPPEFTIDIKPGDEMNSHCNNGKTVIPVAILGSVDLDVQDIVPTSISLEALLKIKTVEIKDKPLFHFKDVNEDGYEDIMIQFADVEGVFAKDDKIAILSGNLNDGKFFYGKDSIRIVP